MKLRTLLLQVGLLACLFGLIVLANPHGVIVFQPAGSNWHHVRRVTLVKSAFPGSEWRVGWWAGDEAYPGR